MSEKTMFTVTDAAGEFGKTPARIRQICLEHGIGLSIENRIRLLSRSDIGRIKEIIHTNGRGKTPEKPEEIA